MEPQVDVSSNDCSNVKSDHICGDNVPTIVLKEKDTEIRVGKEENNCQTKVSNSVEASNVNEKAGVNDSGGKIDNGHSFPIKEVAETDIHCSPIGELVETQDSPKTSVEDVQDSCKNSFESVQDSSKTIVESAEDSSKTIVESAEDSSKTIVESAEDSSKSCVEGAQESSKITAEGAQNSSRASVEDILEKNMAEGTASPCSQQDMFASEPPSPGIVACTMECSSEAKQQIPECAINDRIEVDSNLDATGEGRVPKRQHGEATGDCSQGQPNSDAEGSLAKRPRHSVEIVCELPPPLPPSAASLSLTMSMSRSEEFLNITEETDESINLHYSPSSDEMETSDAKPSSDHRAPSMSTVVLGSDDEVCEAENKTIETDSKTHISSPAIEKDKEIKQNPTSSVNEQLNHSLICVTVESKLPSNKAAAAPTAHSSPYEDKIPVPQYESLCSSLEHQSPFSPEHARGITLAKLPTSTSISENSDRILEMTKDVMLRVQTVLHYREVSREVICYELTQCDIVEEAAHSSATEMSSGNAADDSKNTSPGSVMSVGPFPLAIRVSTTSSSSSSSLTSAAHLALSHANKRSRAGVRVLNLDLVASALHKIGPEALPVPSALFAGRKARAAACGAASNKFAERIIKEDEESKETVSANGALPSPAGGITPVSVDNVEAKQQSTPRTGGKRGRSRGASARGRSRVRVQLEHRQSPQLGEPLTWGTEDASRFKGMLQTGASAFARWSDKRYYSAKLTERQRDNRWLVVFDDGSSKTMKEDFVIPVETLTKGQLVYATLPDGTCADGIVSALFVQDDQEQYGVELDDGREVIVPRRDIFLTEDQARLLLEGATVTLPAPSTPGRLADVDLNNLVTGKRNRTPVHPSSGPGTPRTAGPSGNVVSSKVSCSSSPSDRSSVTGATTDDTISVCGVEPESEGCKIIPVATGSTRGKGKVSAKGKGKALFATANILQDSGELNETLGPIPPKNSKIFEGMIFLLTSVDFEINKSYEKLQELCSDSEGEREFSKYPFVKDRLRLQLETGGGTVLESLDDVPEDRLSDTILITNRPCLTAKYICCLAKPVKIVYHEFVIQRVKGASCTPNSFGTPLGWSLLDNRFVGNAAELGSTLRTRKGGSRQLLARKKLVLIHETPQFLAFWQRVLTDLGAKTATYSPKDAAKAEADLKSADAIVSDSSCPPYIQERGREWRKPLVSTTWITQCLINREVLPFNALPNFSFDFSE